VAGSKHRGCKVDCCSVQLAKRASQGRAPQACLPTYLTARLPVHPPTHRMFGLSPTANPSSSSKSPATCASPPACRKRRESVEEQAMHVGRAGGLGRPVSASRAGCHTPLCCPQHCPDPSSTAQRCPALRCCPAHLPQVVGKLLVAELDAVVVSVGLQDRRRSREAGKEKGLAQAPAGTRCVEVNRGT